MLNFFYLSRRWQVDSEFYLHRIPKVYVTSKICPSHLWGPCFSTLPTPTSVTSEIKLWVSAGGSLVTVSFPSTLNLGALEAKSTCFLWDSKMILTALFIWVYSLPSNANSGILKLLFGNFIYLKWNIEHIYVASWRQTFELDTVKMFYI